MGVASFGPVELRPGRPHYGYITSTPKPGWRDTDLVGPIRTALDVPIGFDTDVAGAALGEGRWGAAQGLGTFVYMTVGTGIGAAAVVGGRLAVGLGHAEMGHVSVPRQPGDTYPGGCPYHGDCLEGMAAGGAIAARFGRPAEQLDGADLRQAVEWEAGYLAEGLRTFVYTVMPERIVIGGSVPQLPGLFPLVRVEAGARRWPATARCPEHGGGRLRGSRGPGRPGRPGGRAGAGRERAAREQLTVHDRSVLGPADVDDARLAAMVAAALGVDRGASCCRRRAEVVAYDIEALTTAGRYRVAGGPGTTAARPASRSSSRSCSRGSRSPLFRSSRRSSGRWRWPGSRSRPSPGSTAATSPTGCRPD